MTHTDSEARPGPETWLAARLAAGLPAETWMPMARIGRCEFSGYEVSDTGRARSRDRAARNGRPLTGGPVSTRSHKDGYVLADFRCDNPACTRAHTFTLQKAVLWTFDRRRPRGMDASHLYGNPGHNWWPEGLAWEDKPANEGRKIDRPPAPGPTHPCRNAPDGCGNKVINPGRRCKPCVVAAGQDIAGLCRTGTPLPEAAARYGIQVDWAYKIACDHGGYTGSKAEAIAQRPSLKGWRKKAAQLLGVG